MMTTKRPLKPMLLAGALAIGMAGIGLTLPASPALGMPAPTESMESLKSPFTSIDMARHQVQRNYGRKAKEDPMTKKESSMPSRPEASLKSPYASFDTVRHQVQEKYGQKTEMN